eukprot:11696268-Alexandrium_andersonii.AAC.1
MAEARILLSVPTMESGRAFSGRKIMMEWSKPPGRRKSSMPAYKAWAAAWRIPVAAVVLL